MFEPHSSVRFIFLNSDKRSPRAGIGGRRGGRWELEKVASRDSTVPFFFFLSFSFNAEESAVATRIQERREFGKSGNVVLLIHCVLVQLFSNYIYSVPSM